MNETSPCKGCTNRHTACHGSCELYKEWRDRYQAQQKHLEANKNRWGIPWSASRERMIRSNLTKGAILRKQGGSQ